MDLTLHEGNALAHAAAALRPDWTPGDAGTALARGTAGEGLPAADFPHAMQALVRYAADPGNVDLEPFTTPGAHWDATTPSPKEHAMTTTTATPARLSILDQATELGLVQQIFPGEYAADMRVSTKLTITGTDEEGRHGFVDLTIRDDEQDGQAKFDMDASQARQLSAYLLQVADELDARTQCDLEFRAAA